MSGRVGPENIRPARPNSVNKRFIIWPLSVKNFEIQFEPKQSVITYHQTAARGTKNKNLSFISSRQTTKLKIHRKTRIRFFIFVFQFKYTITIHANRIE